MLKQVSFKHGWFYHYRFCEDKINILCNSNFSTLKDYFYNMLTSCPHDYFLSGPRSSSLKFDLNTDICEEKLSKLSLLTKEALNWKNYKTAHSNVEVFMLNYDKNTLAVEIPIWILPEEYPMFSDLFIDEKNPLSGHIDILQIIDGKIWILDFKPKAHLEKFAKTQTYMYAVMLSKRTGISLENFMCGYFDENTSYTFSPSLSELNVPIKTPLLINNS